MSARLVRRAPDLLSPQPGWLASGMPGLSRETVELSTDQKPAEKPKGKRRIRILHSVGHLRRGGIEMWLYQMIRLADPSRFDHHVLVRTNEEEPFTDAFRRLGVRVIPCRDYTRPVKYARNLRLVVRANGPYDILHVHGSNPNGLLALLFARSLGISIRIIHSHNDVRPLLRSRGIAYRSYVGLTLRSLRFLAHHGFAASALAAESMFGPSWARDDRWTLLYCGVDFKPFAEHPDPDLRDRLGIPKDAFVIGHVGRFHEQKNHAFLVKIAEEVTKRSANAHFLLIGDGDLRSGIASELKSKGLDRNVTFVPDTLSVPKFMLSAMDCFVFPSRYEGLGLVAVEAQAAGLSCFISDHVPPEAIVDSTLVTVLGLGDPPEVWAETILASRGARTREPALNLARFHRSPFNLEQSAETLARAYESLMALEGTPSSKRRASRHRA